MRCGTCSTPGNDFCELRDSGAGSRGEAVGEIVVLHQAGPRARHESSGIRDRLFPGLAFRIAYRIAYQPEIPRDATMFLMPMAAWPDNPKEELPAREDET